MVIRVAVVKMPGLDLENHLLQRGEFVAAWRVKFVTGKEKGRSQNLGARRTEAVFVRRRMRTA